MKNKNEAQIFMKNVKSLRRYYGLSKKEMAEIMNVSVYTINKIEKENLPPKLSVTAIFDLQEYFGIKAEDLVSFLFSD